MVRVHHEDPEHRAHLPAWRIHALTRDFRLEDVWALPTPGGPDDFPRPVQGIAGGRQGDPRMAATRLPAQDRSDRGGLGVNVPLIVAGSLAILGAAIHGVGGEVLVVRKLSPGMLPSSPFGGPRMTKSMIHVTWHMTTIAFLTVGSALLLSGSVLRGDGVVGSSLTVGVLGWRGQSRGRSATSCGLWSSRCCQRLSACHRRPALWPRRDSRLLAPLEAPHDTIPAVPIFSAYDGTDLAYHVFGAGAPLVCLPGGPMQDSVYLGELGGLLGTGR